MMKARKVIETENVQKGAFRERKCREGDEERSRGQSASDRRRLQASTDAGPRTYGQFVDYLCHIRNTMVIPANQTARLLSR